MGSKWLDFLPGNSKQSTKNNARNVSRSLVYVPVLQEHMCGTVELQHFNFLYTVALAPKEQLLNAQTLIEWSASCWQPPLSSVSKFYCTCTHVGIREDEPSLYGRVSVCNMFAVCLERRERKEERKEGRMPNCFHYPDAREREREPSSPSFSISYWFVCFFFFPPPPPHLANTRWFTLFCVAVEEEEEGLCMRRERISLALLEKWHSNPFSVVVHVLQ